MDAAAFNTAAEHLTAEEEDLLVQLLGGSASKVIAEVTSRSATRGRTLTFQPSLVTLRLDDEVSRAAVTIVVSAPLDALDEGNLTPARAVAQGQVQIIGDASFLTSAQRLLASISSRVE